MTETICKILIDVETAYLEEQSEPKDHRYVFAYTITIRNEGPQPAQLLTRHWIITDANGKGQEVRGDGVVGEQPHLAPGLSVLERCGARNAGGRDAWQLPNGCRRWRAVRRADPGVPAGDPRRPTLASCTSVPHRWRAMPWAMCRAAAPNSNSC